jgi:hypothetical protein
MFVILSGAKNPCILSLPFGGVRFQPCRCNFFNPVLRLAAALWKNKVEKSGIFFEPN